MKKFILLMISLVICFQTILPTRGLENTDRVIEEQVVEEVVDNHIDETVEVNNLQSDVVGNVTYNIPFINKAELIQRIDSLENMMIFLGNTTNDQFRQLIDEFNNLYTDIDENVKKHIVMIQDNTLTVDEINKYIVDNSDYSIIQQALTEINNSTYGHNLILSIDSGSIVRVTDINSGKPEEYSWKDIANKELSINYPILIRQDNNISTFALNDNWSYKAKHGIQKFTAPISGKYLFNIWGADGDSDMGLKAVGVNEGLGHTTGIGGAAGYTSGIVHLDEGQVVYLSLGFRNNFSERRSYNGGGKGYGLSYGYRAGGGGAASVYLTQRGNGEIHNYQNNQEDIIMIAGGGGGAEDFYATGLQDFYCNTNTCITSIGGAGGPNPNGGISTGPTGEGGKYLFGYGEDYISEYCNM